MSSFVFAAITVFIADWYFLSDRGVYQLPRQLSVVMSTGSPRSESFRASAEVTEPMNQNPDADGEHPCREHQCCHIQQATAEKDRGKKAVFILAEVAARVGLRRDDLPRT